MKEKTTDNRPEYLNLKDGRELRVKGEEQCLKTLAKNEMQHVMNSWEKHFHIHSVSGLFFCGREKVNISCSYSCIHLPDTVGLQQKTDWQWIEGFSTPMGSFREIHIYYIQMCPLLPLLNLVKSYNLSLYKFNILLQHASNPRQA